MQISYSTLYTHKNQTTPLFILYIEYFDRHTITKNGKTFSIYSIKRGVV